MSWTQVSIRQSLKEEIDKEIKDTTYGNLSRFVDLALRNELDKLRKEKMDKLFIEQNGKTGIKS